MSFMQSGDEVTEDEVSLGARQGAVHRQKGRSIYRPVCLSLCLSTSLYICLSLPVSPTVSVCCSLCLSLPASPYHLRPSLNDFPLSILSLSVYFSLSLSLSHYIYIYIYIYILPQPFLYFSMTHSLCTHHSLLT